MEFSPFDFDIETNANIEVILNRESGHGMKGKGKDNGYKKFPKEKMKSYKCNPLN